MTIRLINGSILLNNSHVVVRDESCCCGGSGHCCDDKTALVIEISGLLASYTDPNNPNAKWIGLDTLNGTYSMPLSGSQTADCSPTTTSIYDFSAVTYEVTYSPPLIDTVKATYGFDPGILRPGSVFGGCTGFLPHSFQNHMGTPSCVAPEWVRFDKIDGSSVTTIAGNTLPVLWHDPYAPFSCPGDAVLNMTGHILFPKYVPASSGYTLVSGGTFAFKKYHV